MKLNSSIVQADNQSTDSYFSDRAAEERKEEEGGLRQFRLE